MYQSNQIEKQQETRKIPLHIVFNFIGISVLWNSTTYPLRTYVGFDVSAAVSHWQSENLESALIYLRHV